MDNSGKTEIIQKRIDDLEIEVLKLKKQFEDERKQYLQSFKHVGPLNDCCAIESAEDMRRLSYCRID